jgi:hypothetical protein
MYHWNAERLLIYIDQAVKVQLYLQSAELGPADLGPSQQFSSKALHQNKI